MINTEELSKYGLSPAESAIYLTLLKKGLCTVKEISKEAGFHRTNIYDILEQLREKGLVSVYKEGKSARYKAADPNNLLSYLKEKEDQLTKIIPELTALQAINSQSIEVEVFKGSEGMKSMFRDILREGKTLYSFGVTGQLREHLPEFGKWWIASAEKKKIKYYAVYESKKNLPGWFTEIRLAEQEFQSPTATFIYGDKVCINIWNPSLVAIVIRSKEVASTYKRHFDALWKNAKRN